VNVNLDFVPKKSKKIEKVRFEGWKAYEKRHIEQKTAANLIAIMKEMHDYLETEYSGISGFNYTPTMLVFVCNFPKGRSRSVVYFHFKKGHIKIETILGHVSIYNLEDFNSTVKTMILGGFNQLSTTQK
jgi:hypothetical protein